ncbi:hypothetical protein BCR39DRAFT_548201 [Naematelia encephala]|uniref:Uncharacterized protein n=1 Tax=Naematelia encephala TaxID=71784 RepID=A0A1Y2AN73_9TREE|nr:hypothetical protein BCR39DRAFT_548201 [Naematelia encephala]
MASRVASCVLRAVVRQSVILPRGRAVVVRSLHSSSSVAAKKRSPAKATSARTVEEDEPEDEDDSEDLFAVDDSEMSDSEPSSSSTPEATRERSRGDLEARQALRASLVDYVYSTATADPDIRRHRRLGEMRVGVLKKIVVLSEKNQLDELRGILRAWRMIQMRITRHTATELIAKCIKSGRIDLALELSEDRTQYGLPALDVVRLTQLHRVMLVNSYTPESKIRLPTIPAEVQVTPELALVRLRLLQRAATYTTPQTERGPDSETIASSESDAADQSTLSDKPPIPQAVFESELEGLVRRLQIRGSNVDKSPRVAKQIRFLSGPNVEQKYRDAAALIMEKTKSLEATQVE